MPTPTGSARIETVVNLCKRRGFVFPSGEIYGGTRSAWDYGPLGVELKDNIKRQWWKTMVTGREDVVGLDSSVILPRQVWVASGHVDVFTDPLVECTNCHRRFRADQLAEDFSERTGGPSLETVDAEGKVGYELSTVPCPNCGVRGQYTAPREFNMMLKTYLGPVESEEGLHYLRPETAQGIFVNFANVMSAARKKPPFGIGQIGKSFRNEITPGNFIFRTREFEQMEMEFFVEPGSDEQWHQYWIDERTRWYTDLGIAPENLRHYEHPKEKLSHYSKRTVDVEYKFQFNAGQEWGELEGVANRTDFDLTTHSNHSGVDLSYYDQATDSRYKPYVIEPAAGVGRPMMAFLLEAYTEDEAPERQGRRRQAHRAQARPAPGAGEGRGAAAEPQRRPLARRPRPRGHPAQALERRVRRRRRHRPSLPAPGRDRHPVLRHRRLRLAAGPGRHRPPPRRHDPGARRPSTSSSPTSPPA